uniref:Uncharacterized protein n=1 Tax=viral metagenome TaxID=1070528 RepID=A0A6M3XMV2_9ZZZZ
MYKLMKTGVQRLSDMAFIPDTPGNKDWREYKKWLSEGNTPDPEYTQTELDAQAAKIAEEKARRQDMDTIMPDWATFLAKTDAVQNISDIRNRLKEQARILYWLAKNKAE